VNATRSEIGERLQPGPASLDLIDWIFGGAITAGCLVTYLILRPPLYDYDGYMYRLWATAPEAWDNANPHHVLWNVWQMAIANLAYSLGHPTTVTFQVVGILTGCAVLFFFYAFLRKTLDNRAFAGAAVLFLAFTPALWFVTLQNHPYPLALLFLVFYFLCWQSREGSPPSTWRLVAAGVCLSAASLFHQALILLILPAAVVLVVYGKEDLRARLLRSSLWSTAVCISILSVYVWFWQTIDPDDSLLRWSSSYAEELHPPQILQMGVLPVFARAVAGFSGSLIQTAWLKASLTENLPKSEVFGLYSVLGLGLLGMTVFLFTRQSVRKCIFSLTRKRPLFALAAFSTLAWWAFAFSWEGATEHYWLPGTLPFLFCIGMIMKEQRWFGLSGFVIALSVISGWNLYANHAFDNEASVSFPDSGLRAITQNVRGDDIFVVLNGAAHNDADYGLLLDILKMAPPTHGLSIADDLIAQPNPSKGWQSVLKDRIDSVLAAGGKVYVASHLFEQGEYVDLAQENDPFAEQTNPQFSSIDPEDLYEEVTELLSHYSMKRSNFSIGADSYLVIEPRGRSQPTATPHNPRDVKK
jgi:4-amino-4-deoxy-L-arabinose transferase-like glycosyltransferase